MLREDAAALMCRRCSGTWLGRLNYFSLSHARLATIRLPGCSPTFLFERVNAQFVPVELPDQDLVLVSARVSFIPGRIDSGRDAVSLDLIFHGATQ